MLRVHGQEVVFYESKDFGDRTKFSPEYQYRTATRWASSPSRLAAHQRRKNRSIVRLSQQASREFMRILQPLLADPKKRYAATVKKAEAWMEQYVYKAYRLGMDAAGIGDLPLSDEDMKWLTDDYYESEVRYLRTFLKGIHRGTVSAARARVRARLYGEAMRAVYYTALVASFPHGKGTRIEWRLGVAEHCPDCLELGQKRYFTPKTLPTTPCAGATRCLSNCRCELIVEFRPAGIKLVPPSTPSKVVANVETDDPVIIEIGIEPDSPLAELLL